MNIQFVGPSGTNSSANSLFEISSQEWVKKAIVRPNTMTDCTEVRVLIGASNIRGDTNGVLFIDDVVLGLCPIHLRINDTMYNEIKDTDLKSVDSGNPLHFIVESFDELSGLAVGEGQISTQSYLTANSLFYEKTDINEAQSSLDTSVSGATSVWTYADTVTTNSIIAWKIDGGIPLQLMLRDRDNDWDGDINEDLWPAHLYLGDDDDVPPSSTLLCATTNAYVPGMTEMTPVSDADLVAGGCLTLVYRLEDDSGVLATNVNASTLSADPDLGNVTPSWTFTNRFGDILVTNTAHAASEIYGSPGDKIITNVFVANALGSEYLETGKVYLASFSQDHDFDVGLHYVNKSMVNPGFEEGYSDWVFSPSGDNNIFYGASETCERTGTWGFWFTNAIGTRSYYQEVSSILPDTEYYLSVNARKIDTMYPTFIGVRVDYYDGSWHADWQQLNLRDDLTTNWKEFSTTFTTPAAATSLRIRLYHSAASTGQGVVYFDDCVLTPTDEALFNYDRAYGYDCAGAVNVFDDDTNGPIAELLYVGDNYSPGDTGVSITDADLHDGIMDVAYRWSDADRVLKSLGVHRYDSGKNYVSYNGTSANLDESVNDITPIWMLTNTELGVVCDRQFNDISSIYGNNSSVSLTNVITDVVSSSVSTGDFYLVVSAQDQDQDRGKGASGANLLDPGFESQQSTYDWGYNRWFYWRDDKSSFDDGVGIGGSRAYRMGAGGCYQDVPAEPGVTYYFSIYVRKGSAGAINASEIQIHLRFDDDHDNGETDFLSNHSINIIDDITTDWQQFEISGTAPAGTVYVRPFVFAYNASTINLYWDNARLSQSVNSAFNRDRALTLDQALTFSVTDDDDEGPVFSSMCFNGSEGTVTDGSLAAGLTITGLIQDASGIYGNAAGSDRPVFTLFSPLGQQGAADQDLNNPAINDGDGVAPSPIGSPAQTIDYADRVLGTWTVRVDSVDMDDDGWVGDNLASSSNIAFEVIDDDTDAPLACQLEGTPSWGGNSEDMYVVIATNGHIVADRFDDGTNVNYFISDGYLANLDATHTLEFVFGGIDDSGLSRDAAGADTNLYMSFSLGDALSGEMSGFDNGASSPDAEGVVLTNVWTFDDNSVFTPAVITDLVFPPVGSSNAVMVTMPDADNDRADDTTRLDSFLAGWLSITDDDADEPDVYDIRFNEQVSIVTDGDLAAHGLSITGRVSDFSGIKGGEDPMVSLYNPDGVLYADLPMTNPLLADGAGAPVSDIGRTNMTIGYTDRVLGTWTAVVTVTDMDDDGWGVNDQITGVSNFVFSVADDDTTPPTELANVEVQVTHWTNRNYFVVAFDPSVDSSGISEYRRAENGAKPTAISDGDVIALGSAGELSTDVVTNASFEVGVVGDFVNDWPNVEYGWYSGSSAGARGHWTADEADDGANSMRMSVDEVASGVRYAQIVQRVDYHDVPADAYAFNVTFSGSFLGDLSEVDGSGEVAVGFLKIQFYDELDTLLLTVDNEYDTDHNGQPLNGVNAADWTNITITALNVTTNAAYAKFSCGISAVSTNDYVGYWDNLESETLYVTKSAVLITNASEGCSTNWLYSVDADNDRLNDGMMSPVTNAVIKYDATAPDQVTTFSNNFDDIDITTEMRLHWNAISPGNLMDQELSPFYGYEIYLYDTELFTTVVVSRAEYECLQYSNTVEITISNLPCFAANYDVWIRGIDEAGNYGLMSDIANVQMGMFTVTQGVVNAENIEIYWEPALDLNNEPYKPYDLIACNSYNFGNSLSNQEHWDCVGTVVAGMASESVNNIPTNGMMRFYRAAPSGYWSNRTVGVASIEIYVAMSFWVYPGMNWVSFPGMPDVPTPARVFGHNLPSSAVYGPNTTRITWHAKDSDGGNWTNQIWLADGDPPQWMDMDTNNVDDTMTIPMREAAVIRLPIGAEPHMITFIGKVPTNSCGIEIKGNGCNNFVGANLPRNLHPSQMNLLESGLHGARWSPFADKIRLYDRINEQPYNTIYYYTNGADYGWRISSQSGHEGWLDASYTISPDHAISIETGIGTGDWVWTNKCPYDSPNQYIVREEEE